jgi:ATP-binding cassette subfamily F protein 3
VHVLDLSQVGLSPAGHPLFRQVDWRVGGKERIGLVGPNGAGKSSLLRLMADVLRPDEGEVRRRRGATVGYLPQEIHFGAGSTLLDQAMAPPPALATVEFELGQIGEALADPAVYQHPKRLERVLLRQEEALARFDALGGTEHPGRVRALLAHFGFREANHHEPANGLSGGQKKLVALIALAIAKPDLLLLDEPDNHLDWQAKIQLERFIRDYPGSVIVVSHDRYLLDSTVDRIAELDAARFELFKGNYSVYSTERELRRLHQQRHHAAQQKEIARIEASIARFERWASMVVNERHIKQARSRRRGLERMQERGEIVEQVREARAMGLVLEGGRGSRKALELEGISMRFGDSVIFADVDLLLRHGERVGLVGPNGCGKSVLLKVIIGELQPVVGRVKIGPSTRVGYYCQEHETLGPWVDRTPLDLIRDTSPVAEGAAVSFLMKFLFRYDQVRQPIAALSGGELSRLQLARLVLQKPNLLLLDEPTNNLDIPSAEALESALEDFEGTLLVVSHDRYFLDRVVDRVIELDAGALAVFEGGYTDYLTEKSGGSVRG